MPNPKRQKFITTNLRISRATHERVKREAGQRQIPINQRYVDIIENYQPIQVQWAADLLEAAIEAAAQRGAQKALEFQAYGDQEDEAFRDTAPESSDPVHWDQLQDAAVDVLVEDFGFIEDELEREWNSNPFMRDQRFQRMLAQLARQRLARIKRIKAIEAKVKQPKKLVTPGESDEK